MPVQSTLQGAAAPDSYTSFLDALLREALLALQSFTQNFTLVFYLRAGLALLTRVLTLLQRSPAKLLSWHHLLHESKLDFRVGAVRLGLFVGGFAALYRLLRALLSAALPDACQAAAVSAAGAGVALAALPAETRRTFALYAFARALQCGWGVLARLGLVPASVLGGAASLFAVSSAAVMQAYVLHPKTLPPSYISFIVRTGPIAAPVLRAVRLQQAGAALPLDLRAWLQRYVSTQHPSFWRTWFGAAPPPSKAPGPVPGCSTWLQPSYPATSGVGSGGVSAGLLPHSIAVQRLAMGQDTAYAPTTRRELWRGLLQAIGWTPTPEPGRFPGEVVDKVAAPHITMPAHLQRIPAALMHPRQRSSVLQALQTAMDASRRVLPLYTSLNLVPLAVFRWRKLLSSPSSALFKALTSALQSSAFIGAFVGSYMAMIDLHRWACRGDHPAVYWLAGLVAGYTVLLERPSRHVDLSLYVLPRALDSLYKRLAQRGMVVSIPHGDVLLFAVAMAMLMATYEAESGASERGAREEGEGGGGRPPLMAPFLRSLLRFFIGPTTSVAEELATSAGSAGDLVVA